MSARARVTMSSRPPSGGVAPSVKPTTACSIGNGALLRTCHRTSSARSLALGGIFSKRMQRHLSRRIRDDQRRATHTPAEPLDDVRHDARERRDVADIWRGKRRNDDARRERLDGVRDDARRRAAPREPRGRHVRRVDLNRHIRRRRLEQRALAHSTNVTLLISRRVVVPCSTRSTADSRSMRIPCSLAARFSSEMGRLSRINSRM